jgi:hypothetical protein
MPNGTVGSDERRKDFENRRRAACVEDDVMASWRDVQRIVLALPETSEKTASAGTSTWMVRDKSFAWERPLRAADLAALGKAAPTGPILGVRTADLEMKEALLAADPAVFFTTPHFNGYSAVLIRLDRIAPATLCHVLVDSWLARAPKRVAATFLEAKKHRSSSD